MRLRLKAYADVFYGPREHGISDACKGPTGVVLCQAQGADRLVARFEKTACKMEATELDRDTGTNADERGEGPFIEGERTFMRPDPSSAIKGAGILSRCL